MYKKVNAIVVELGWSLHKGTDAAENRAENAVLKVVVRSSISSNPSASTAPLSISTNDHVETLLSLAQSSVANGNHSLIIVTVA